MHLCIAPLLSPTAPANTTPLTNTPHQISLPILYRPAHNSPVPEYRRHRVAGATYFFTVNLLDRRSRLLTERIGILRQAVSRVRILMPFHIDAWVVLPDHMHCLWTLPECDGNFPKRWQAIKMAFSRSVTPGEPLSTSRLARGERGIWQRRYWEHTVRDERDYASHMDYIHFNPVKHGLAASAAEWQFSSFQSCVKQGLYPPEWTSVAETSGDWGERR
jgi:putative transposase